LFKDQAIFAGNEIQTQAGRPYSVFTPYKNAWLKRLTAGNYAEVACKGALADMPGSGVPALASIGFQTTDLESIGITPGMSGARELLRAFAGDRLRRYGELRDYPAVHGVSYLSVHFRFGTLSIREAVRLALAAKADVWLNELIWRDFYFMILDCFPHVVGSAFKPEYDALVWDDNPEAFARWCAGQTGYPLVDAAMRQLLHSGWMHNRLRMLVASFLTKDLGIDWRLGERYFAEQLLDFDLSANNGGWQWAASTGCDAQPYFRIFNPITQSEKFDPQGRFIRRYVPELASVPDRYIHAPWRMPPLEQQACGVVIGRDYPAPIVDHAEARERSLMRFSAARKV
jgi:deoxyribodipyrimidine photo-lyase